MPDKNERGMIIKLSTVPKWSHLSAQIPVNKPINDNIADEIIAKNNIIPKL